MTVRDGRWGRFRSRASEVERAGFRVPFKEHVYTPIRKLEIAECCIWGGWLRNAS